MDILNSKHLQIRQYNLLTLCFTVKTDGSATTATVPATRLELLELADQLQDAAAKIRSALADEEPGSAFVHNQMLQFGADRLEGDL